MLLNVKLGGSNIDGKSSCEMLVLSFFSKSCRVFYIDYYAASTASKKIRSLILRMMSLSF